MAYRISAELTFWFLVMVVILTIVIVGLSRLINPLQCSQKENGPTGSRNAPAITRYAGYSCFWTRKRELQIFQTLNQVYARLQEKQVSGLAY